MRAFHGVPATVVRALAWVMALGAEGLREVAEVAVLNNNYLAARLADVPGLEVSYADGNAARRLEQIRYSWRELARRDRASRRSTWRAARATSASASTSRATSRGSSRSR